MQIKVPFPVAQTSKTPYEGQMYVDPTKVIAVNRAWGAINVMLSTGKGFSSVAPTLATALLAGTPDDAKLDQWYEDFIVALNAADGT